MPWLRNCGNLNYQGAEARNGLGRALKTLEEPSRRVHVVHSYIPPRNLGKYLSAKSALSVGQGDTIEGSRVETGWRAGSRPRRCSARQTEDKDYGFTGIDTSPTRQSPSTKGICPGVQVERASWSGSARRRAVGYLRPQGQAGPEEAGPGLRA